MYHTIMIIGFIQGFIAGLIATIIESQGIISFRWWLIALGILIIIWAAEYLCFGHLL